MIHTGFQLSIIIWKGRYEKNNLKNQEKPTKKNFFGTVRRCNGKAHPQPVLKLHHTKFQLPNTICRGLGEKTQKIRKIEQETTLLGL